MGAQGYRHTKTGYLVYYDRQDSRTCLRSLVRSVYRLDWSRISSTLLALIVGLTLTLVCEGHAESNHLTGPHLAFMSEPAHTSLNDVHRMVGRSVSSSIRYASAEGGSGHVAPASMSNLSMQGVGRLLTFPTASASSAPDAIATSLGLAANDAPLASESLATLSYMLALSLLWRTVTLSPQEAVTAPWKKSQTGLKPESPPPRASSY